MKKIVIAVFLLFSVGMASAQSTGGSGSKSTTTSKATSKHPAKKKTAKTKKTAKKPLNQRKEYQWKNGQEATPTGHEATGVNGGYSAIRKDSVSKTPVKKHDQ